MAPRVTSLVEERRDRVRIELDGRAWRTLPAVAVARVGLTVGTEVDRSRARELRHELRRLDALEQAARALRRRDRSKASLDAHLERRGVPALERVRAVETLARAGYVDDVRFAAVRARTLVERGYGDEAIRFDLEREGVAADEAEAAVAALPNEVERARAHLGRAGGAAKAARRLASRGFSAESIESALAGRHDPA